MTMNIVWISDRHSSSSMFVRRLHLTFVFRTLATAFESGAFPPGDQALWCPITEPSSAQSLLATGHRYAKSTYVAPQRQSAVGARCCLRCECVWCISKLYCSRIWLFNKVHSVLPLETSVNWMKWIIIRYYLTICLFVRKSISLKC